MQWRNLVQSFEFAEVLAGVPVAAEEEEAEVDLAVVAAEKIAVADAKAAPDYYFLWFPRYCEPLLLLLQERLTALKGYSYYRYCSWSSFASETLLALKKQQKQKESKKYDDRLLKIGAYACTR